MPVTCPSGRSSTVLTVIHEAYTVTMTCMSPGLAGPSRNLLSDESSSILRRLVDHALDFAAVDVEFAGDGSLAGAGFVPGSSAPVMALPPVLVVRLAPRQARLGT